MTLAPGLQAYARMRADAPELVDIVAANADSELATEEEAGAARGAKRQRIYDDHKPMSTVTEGMKQGKLHQVRAWPSMQHACALCRGLLASPTAAFSRRILTCHVCNPLALVTDSYFTGLGESSILVPR